MNGNGKINEIELHDYIHSLKEVDAWESAMLLYNSALKQMQTKVEILSDEFKHVQKYNPIEYVKARIKRPESIVSKLKRYGFSDSIENMIRHVNDIAGLRIICSFTSDIYRLSEMIGSQDDITVLSVKDYIETPKSSGYRSYHMIVSVPVFLSDKVVDTKVEVQIRTIAMDFWASLEHKIQYKFNGKVPDHISVDLWECSDIVSMLDQKMLSLNEAVNRAQAKLSEEEEIKERQERIKLKAELKAEKEANKE
ncbi:MAG: GTP pyrophosphokinase family protein [Lachnospiraceae bacterium]|nr:GTP pyrophosphokinase family protein [Lachnospiraceae bacterium]